MGKVKEQIGSFFGSVGGFFKEFGTAVAKGDIFVKLSLLWMGAGYCKRKQFIKALLMTAFEVAIIAFTFGFAMDYVQKFSTLGTVQQESVFNVMTMKNEFNDYDHSFIHDSFVFLNQFCGMGDFYCGIPEQCNQCL